MIYWAVRKINFVERNGRRLNDNQCYEVFYYGEEGIKNSRSIVYFNDCGKAWYFYRDKVLSQEQFLRNQMLQYYFDLVVEEDNKNGRKT